MAAAGLSDASYSYECNETLVFEEIIVTRVLFAGTLCILGYEGGCTNDKDRREGRDLDEPIFDARLQTPFGGAYRHEGAETGEGPAARLSWDGELVRVLLCGHVGC